MRLFAFAALAAALAFATPAQATRASEQDEAIAQCRTAVAAAAGVENNREAVRFNRIERRSGGLEVRFRVRQENGLLARVDCFFDRAQQLASVLDPDGEQRPLVATAQE